MSDKDDPRFQKDMQRELAHRLIGKLLRILLEDDTPLLEEWNALTDDQKSRIAAQMTGQILYEFYTWRVTVDPLRAELEGR